MLPFSPLWEGVIGFFFVVMPCSRHYCYWDITRHKERRNGLWNEMARPWLSISAVEARVPVWRYSTKGQILSFGRSYFVTYWIPCSSQQNKQWNFILHLFVACSAPGWQIRFSHYRNFGHVTGKSSRVQLCISLLHLIQCAVRERETQDLMKTVLEKRTYSIGWFLHSQNQSIPGKVIKK